MNIKNLYTIAKSKTIQKIYFKDKYNQEYILTNLTQVKSNLELFLIKDSAYLPIAREIKDINNIIKEHLTIIQ